MYSFLQFAQEPVQSPISRILDADKIKVTDKLKIDVTGGEQDTDFRIWKEMINNKVVNIASLDYKNICL